MGHRRQGHQAVHLRVLVRQGRLGGRPDPVRRWREGGEFIWPSYAPYLDRYADALASRIGGGGQVVNLYLDGMRVNDDAAIRQDVLNLVSDLSRYNAAMTAARG